jgi:phosphoribosyl-AMP cyclohydrolase/phosphoribosyl-ATP pyrophosphohydrolase/phosphoribosyl-AMP cyclohydrolase
LCARELPSSAQSGFGPRAGHPYDGPVPLVTPIDATDEQLAHIRYDANGLVPAIVQDAGSRQVLMMAWMTAETLRLTLAEGRTVFWSRSRREVWRKGETSGEVQHVQSAHYDCDGDVLLFVVDQQGGGACHTGNRSCFFRAFGTDDDGGDVSGAPGVATAGP